MKKKTTEWDMKKKTIKKQSFKVEHDLSLTYKLK